MSLCDNCHENVAIIYSSKIVGGKLEYKGYCISCAYSVPELGLSEMLKKAGVNDDNVDLITDQMNSVMETMRDDPPEMLLQRLQGLLKNIDPAELNQGLGEAFKEFQIFPGAKNKKNEIEDEDADQSNLSKLTENENSSGEGNPDSAVQKKDEASGENEKYPQSGESDSKDDENNNFHEGKTPVQGFAFGEKSIADALQMMISGIMGSEFGGADDDSDEFDDGKEESSGGLMPVARGGDIADGSQNDRTRESRQNDKKNTSEKRDRRKRRYLETYGSNLTDLAKEGKLDPIVGREKELSRVIQILNRRRKNNPVLLGEPGVGKTAIAEGLAIKIAEKKVPAKLSEMEVYSIDMTAMVAGTQFRGQFESRMKGLVDEAKKLGNIILVIDEIHNIMGAGDAEGAMNAGNILKPSLAKGEIHVLGSTTLDEYRRFIEHDSALERRLQQVIVEEPSKEETLEILKGLRKHYEDYHFVSISDEMLKYTIDLADRYVSGRFFPDKAIDILDEAGSAANLKNTAVNEITELESEKQEEEDNFAEAQRSFNSKSDENDIFEMRAKHKNRMLSLEQKIVDIKEHLKPAAIEKEDLAGVVELWTGIPVQRVKESDTEKLLNLEKRLHERVIGQEEAVNSLSQAIRRRRAGLGKRNKPASFIFVGPTGVGKTELVKALAESLFGDEKDLVRFDMSEFMEAHTVSKLIGSPPGYVGYDDAGQLTEKVRRHPYSVILFDEIEKAHVDVFNILLQILDDGRLTDSHGRTVNFEHTVIIMTSNVGTGNGKSIGFAKEENIQNRDKVDSALKEVFRPEFLNRIDEVLIFSALKPEEILQIADLMMKELKSALSEKGLRFKISENAKKKLAEEGYSSIYGARPLRKLISKKIENPLSDMLLRGELEGKSEVSVGYSEGKFTFEAI